MKYMVAFPLTKDTFKARAARFLDNGGRPPEGVTMLGRWHALGGDEVFVLAETDDPRRLYRWVIGWADLIDFKVVPVIEDDDVAPILQELQL
jgi:hypothetical protein